MNFVIVGALGGLGKALCKRLAQEGHSLILIASQTEDLQIFANHLSISYGINTITCVTRLSCDSKVIETILTVLKDRPVNGILFPLGYSRDDDKGILTASTIKEIIESNLSGIIALVSAALPMMFKQSSGQFIFFGSVAAQRGRGSNIVYASAKRVLKSYAESLRHLLANTKIIVQYYEVGYLNTAQTWNKKLPFPAAEPKDLAKLVVRNLSKDFGQQYYPWYWFYICLILRAIPWYLYKNIRF